MPASSSFSQERLLGDYPQEQRPPRRVPWPVRIRLLFGGPAAQFGWFWLIATGLFSAIFLHFTDVSALTFKTGQLASAPGTIIAAEDSGASSNEQSIYAYRYRFYTPADEQSYEGVSYSASWFASGQAVAIDYRADDPANSRIRGMRQKPFGPGMLLILVMPLIGLAIGAAALRSGLRSIRLLGGGLLAQGDLLSNRPTNVKIMNKPVHKLEVRFTSESGRDHLVSLKSNNPRLNLGRGSVHVLYDPARPEDVLFLSNLPAPPRVDALGRIALGTPQRNWAALALPALALVVSGLLGLVLAR